MHCVFATATRAQALAWFGNNINRAYGASLSEILPMLSALYAVVFRVDVVMEYADILYGRVLICLKFNLH